jgi:2-iminobutanoate/2-iminopropanoate deaminase
VAEQTTVALERMLEVLKAEGMNYDNVVSTDVLMTDMSNYGTINEAYAKIFTKEAPARAAYAVASLPFGALVEIKAIAVKN